MNAEQLESILVRHAPRLQHIVERGIPPSLQAKIVPEDVLQEVWISAFRSVDSFEVRSPESTAAWLAMIAESRLVDAVRRASALKRGGGDRRIPTERPDLTSFVDLFDLIASPGKTPSRDVSAREIAHAVQIGLSRLPGPERQAMWMHYIEGVRVADVAEAMGKTKAAVHFVLYAGRAKLRELLGRQDRFFTDVPEEGEQPS